MPGIRLRKPNRITSLITRLGSGLSRRVRNRIAVARGTDWRTGCPITKDLKTIRVGTKYGGWVIPQNVLGEKSVCYSVGVGEDISFDIDLIDRFGCSVFAYDPTPRSIDFIRQNYSEQTRLHFFPIGLWNENSVLRFYAPANSDHVSHSIVNLQKTEEYFEADCRRLSYIMKENGHKGLDLLKLDIEGAEYKVIESLLEDQLDVRVICVEYDEAHTPLDDGYLARMTGSIESLLESGYSLVAVDGCNYTFRRDSVTA
ncbi:MAG: FkbM family methyltransferase [Gammaproteobacteria bacterium]|nr:FkbM family methyltransferase [Gammaproteobacteria bacterium]